VQAHGDVVGRESQHATDVSVVESLEREHQHLAIRQRQAAHGALQAFHGLHARGELIGPRRRVGNLGRRVQWLGRGPARGEMGQSAVGSDPHHESLLRCLVAEKRQGAPQGEGDVLQ